ncbi:hypothetical protein [Pelagicoccus sp. SDUM812003]|uniref:hypothetical protein n=1 Tax=Pelagicoccus sp. SDUM812003 TaxID=3041267 RepID=UPI00280C7137|nr:hypothetical protein [Pelagicoccus sp. SDUM812003]MDQ8203351.1 hypothetical protein [Pelagicoccus sp. SDUM812003]
MNAPLNFTESWRQTDDALATLPLGKVFSEVFPDFHSYQKASTEEDRSGTDYFVRTTRRTKKVDVKLLSKDPRTTATREYHDVVPIELYSVCERKIAGYGGDADYVLWIFSDTLRTILVRRQDLVDFVEKRRVEWSYFLREHKQRTKLANGFEYTSSFCWVPYRLINMIEKPSIAA